MTPTNQTLLGFPTGRDSATFRDNGTEVPSLSQDKGTTGQAKNLAKGRNVETLVQTHAQHRFFFRTSKKEGA